MSDIKEKIAKCLSLANSPEQEEARAALLTARKLMAKHKLTEEDVQEKASQKLIKALVNAHFTRMTDAWACSLAKIAAEHHCCATYCSSYSGGKVYTVGFIGLEEDFKICKQVFLYAYEFVKKEAERITKEMNVGASKKRIAKNSYGIGFCSGLKEAYKEQDKLNEEWGLVLVMPPEVNDSLKSMSKRKVNNQKHIDNNSALINKGYQDGKNFKNKNNQKLENNTRKV